MSKQITVSQSILFLLLLHNAKCFRENLDSLLKSVVNKQLFMFFIVICNQKKNQIQFRNAVMSQNTVITLKNVTKYCHNSQKHHKTLSWPSKVTKYCHDRQKRHKILSWQSKNGSHLLFNKVTTSANKSEADFVSGMSWCVKKVLWSCLRLVDSDCRKGIDSPEGKSAAT